jgi:hypothetical protein
MYPRKIDPVPSVYADGNFGKVEITETIEFARFIMQSERVGKPGEPVNPMQVCYTKCENHFYIGDIKTARFITDTMGITEQLQPLDPAIRRAPCAIGFNPETQEWFGWSHRATASFRIGTEVKIGDAGFEPSNEQELESVMMDWHSVGKTVDIGVRQEIKRTRHLMNFRHNVEIDGEASRFTLMEVRDEYVPEDYLKDDAQKVHRIPAVYPQKWGKGEWKAETLEDAKQMAMAFANDVS